VYPPIRPTPVPPPASTSAGVTLPPLFLLTPHFFTLPMRLNNAPPFPFGVLGGAAAGTALDGPAPGEEPALWAIPDVSAWGGDGDRGRLSTERRPSSSSSSSNLYSSSLLLLMSAISIAPCTCGGRLFLRNRRRSRSLWIGGLGGSASKRDDDRDIVGRRYVVDVVDGGR
jgi:hypothetical protein